MFTLFILISVYVANYFSCKLIINFAYQCLTEEDLVSRAMSMNSFANVTALSKFLPVLTAQAQMPNCHSNAEWTGSTNSVTEFGSETNEPTNAEGKNQRTCFREILKITWYILVCC